MLLILYLIGCIVFCVAGLMIVIPNLNKCPWRISLPLLAGAMICLYLALNEFQNRDLNPQQVRELAAFYNNPLLKECQHFAQGYNITNKQFNDYSECAKNIYKKTLYKEMSQKDFSLEKFAKKYVPEEILK